MAYVIPILDFSSYVGSSDLELVQQPTNIVASQIASALGFLHQQRQLLERARRRAGMDGRDRTWMARVDVAQIKEGRAVPQLLQKDAIGPHAQRTLEQLLGADLREPLSLARLDHVHDIEIGRAHD